MRPRHGFALAIAFASAVPRRRRAQLHDSCAECRPQKRASAPIRVAFSCSRTKLTRKDGIGAVGWADHSGSCPVRKRQSWLAQTVRLTVMKLGGSRRRCQQINQGGVTVATARWYLRRILIFSGEYLLLTIALRTKFRVR